MKKIVLILCALFLVNLINKGQVAPLGKYEVYFIGWLQGDNNHHCGKAHVNITFTSGEEYTAFYAEYQEYSPRQYFNKEDALTTFDANKRIYKFHFTAERRTHESCKGTRPNNNGPLIDGVHASLNTPCFSRYFEFKGVGFTNTYEEVDVGLWSSAFTLYVRPRLVILEDASKKLPTEDRITISSHTGFRAAEYNWQYSLNGSTWINLSQYNGQSSISVCAKDILGETADSMIKKNIHFRQVCCNEEIKSSIVTYEIQLSAPRIENVTYQLPTCHKDNDAKLFIHLDRELLVNEKLYISTKGDRFVDKNTTVGMNSQIIEVSGLEADSVDISMIGTYRYGTNLADTVFTYTDGLKHKYSIRIPERPAISMTSLQEAPVHCFDGKDGKIMVRAEGGTGTFDAFLMQGGNQLDSIRFQSNQTGVFYELYTGTYRVFIRDTNGCTLDASGNPVEGTQVVSQPVDSVIILSHYSEEPKGFGLSNGWAQITFKGGTTTNYQVIWKDSLDNTIPNVLTTEGDVYVSKVENIRSSTYFVTVYDANYPLADPRTEENLCGCTDTISFFVTEPPKLEVLLDEHHYVTCFGDNDGQIVAHAWGGRPHLSGLPYTYEWEKVNGSLYEPVNQTDSIITELYSGRYRVKITDRNDIFTYSEVFHLVQPEPLIVTTSVLQNIACSGDSVGIIEATATGGTPPYSYIWSTNDTTRRVSGLPQGNYVVGVRDARYSENILGHYCFAQAYDSIISPTSIRLNATLTHPLCHTYTDGAVDLHITGGTPPYTCLWEDGSTQRLRTGLAGGEYSVKVTDANGCFLEESYLLNDPAPIIVSLGGDLTLCKGQTIRLNGDVGLPNMNYVWTDADNLVVSVENVFDVDRPGVYTLTASTIDGCTGSDEIRVYMSQDEVHADFIIATRVAEGANVHAVNITRNEIDSIRWIIPEDVTVVGSEGDKIELVFPEKTEYTIGMIAYKNDCRDILYKTVTVVDKRDLGEDESEEPFIKRFIVSPNPNKGEFKVVVELREKTDYSLLLYDGAGKLIETKQVYDQLYESTQFNVSGTGTGVFYLRFVSAQAVSVFHVIIN